MKPHLVFGFFTALALATLGSATSLRDRLTPEEFAKAGLGRLSASELTALESALDAHGWPAATTTPAPEANASGASSPAVTSPPKAQLGDEQIMAKQATKPTSQVLVARVRGTMDGCDGKSTFALDNGQVWQQRNGDAFYFGRTLSNFEVVITRGPLGYRLQIIDLDRVIAVKRVH